MGMIKNYGHEYTVKAVVNVEVEVTGHGQDDAAENAERAIDEALKGKFGSYEVEVVGMERGDEALDITEDD